MEKPTIPKGTRDFGPAQMAKRQFIFESIRRVFKKYGFQPLETPTMENLETLTGKYGDEGDQLIFKILNSGDFLKGTDPQTIASGDFRRLAPEITEKGLRYDLTVPFARYVVMNRHEITFPFRRYQIQPVWRADRPQKGRYREFYQCDADVVGTDSLVCEVEIILMITEIFQVLGLSDYTIKLNHRAVLSGLAELTGSKDVEMALFVAIDKLDKVGAQKVTEELREKGVRESDINLLFEILDFKGSAAEKIELLSNKFGQIETGLNGLADLKIIFALLKDFPSIADHLEFDIALARGLSYYTGAIFEIKINNVAIGSVSGGGRYDNLTGVFGLPDVSGVGISFGVDRLYDAMEELKLFPAEAAVSSQILVTHTDDDSFRYGFRLTDTLRKNGIATEIYPDQAKLKKQFEYADKRSIPFVVVIGSDEMSSGLMTFKDMKSGEQQKLSPEQIMKLVQVRH